MDNYIRIEIERVLRQKKFDPVIIQDFEQRLRRKNLIRDENPLDHFCSFIVPIDKKSKKIFLGHHKKADDWIPPGGHIDKGESPIEAAVREAKEELGVTISEKQLELFTLDYLDVSGPNKICKMHWHIWYLFNTDEQEYVFDTGEFHDAGWFTLSEAMQKVKREKYRKIIKDVFQQG
jgi:8-oxo-dGTP pyrophosphatase MutT (NUDIX family)